MKFLSTSTVLLCVGLCVGCAATLPFDEYATAEGGAGQGGQASSGGGSPTGGSGGSDQAEPQALFIAGSRLVPRVMVGSDGSREQRGWFDTELGVACAYMRSTDGTMRCLPPARNYVYTDSSCSKVAVRMDFYSCAQDTIACYLDSSFSCMAGDGYLCGHIGAAMSDSAHMYVASGDSCTLANTFGSVGGVKYYAMTDTMQPSEFVQGTEQ